MMEYTEKKIEILKNCGALGYPIQTIMSILDINEEEKEDFKKEFKAQNSEAYKHYRTGADVSQYQIDLKLHEMALSGDIKAMEKLDKKRKGL